MSDVDEYESLLDAASLRVQAEELRERLRASELTPADSRAMMKLVELERALAAAEEERDAALREIDRANSTLREQAMLLGREPEYRARVRELEQLVSTLSVGIGDIRGDIERAAASRAWRYGHRAMRAVKRLALRRDKTEGALVRAIARIDRLSALDGAHSSSGGPGGTDANASRSVIAPLWWKRTTAQVPASLLLPAPPMAGLLDVGALGKQVRERLGPVPVRDEWPAVSIVVLNRDGRAHLERLVAGLQRSTDYPDFELIVVDNGSGDDSVAYLKTVNTAFPVSVVANSTNAPFSEANAQGAAQATHELLLFLNNDIEPFEAGWLKELVAALRDDRVAAVGARLVHRDSGGTIPVVQHDAIAFRHSPDGVRPYNRGDGEDVFGQGFGLEQAAPAVTAASMLIRRDEFEALGGFRTGYRYGTEDVDLCLTLTASGRRVLASGRVLLLHNESATQRAEARDVIRINRTMNRRIFLERWGAQVRRAYRVGRLERDRFWTDGRGPHIAITLTSADPEAAWGDWYTAHELGDELEARDWRVTYVERRGDRWYELPDDLDYVLTLMDTFDARNVPPGVVVVAWIRNWTDRWIDRPWFERLDVLLSSSEGSSRRITERTGRPSISFPLATNPARFAAAATAAAAPPHPEPVVFTGNRWGDPRDAEQALTRLPVGQVAVYGKGWEQVPEVEHLVRGWVPFPQLPAIYAGAQVVLDDTQSPCLPYGALNARVFDALAAGTVVVTNCVDGVRELFDADFPVWSEPGEIGPVIDALLSDDQRRHELGRRYQREVLEKHTYAQRAERLIEVLRGVEQQLSFCIKIGAPNWEDAERWGDLYFARSLGRELQRRGHRYLIQVLPEWDDPQGLEYDVVVHLKGLSRYIPKSGQFNVLWCISHPDELTGEECDGYDLVCAASPSFAEELRERTATPVSVLEQATDPHTFFPDFSPEFAHELVYVANSRGRMRPIIRDLLPTHHDLAIYGGNWDGLIDPALVRAAFIANDQLRKVYSSGWIVLADHWDDMRAHGFISNRIYDAVACGAFVICDDVAGLGDRFGDRVRTYRSPEELRALIEERLAQPRRASEPPPTPVPTFADRAQALLEAIANLRTTRTSRMLVG